MTTTGENISRFMFQRYKLQHFGEYHLVLQGKQETGVSAFACLLSIWHWLDLYQKSLRHRNIRALKWTFILNCWYSIKVSFENYILECQVRHVLALFDEKPHTEILDFVSFFLVHVFCVPMINVVPTLYTFSPQVSWAYPRWNVMWVLSSYQVNVNRSHCHPKISQ